MIITEIYNGQGLGNQLHCYITLRVLALDKGYKFGIQNPEKFKCLEFMDLEIGEKVVGGEGPEGGPPIKLPDGIKHYFKEKEYWHPNGSDLRNEDERLYEVQDNTKIEGYFQSEKKLLKYKNEIKKWLKIKLKYDCYDYSDDNICVINFRGGIYAGVPDFFLNQDYWNNAIQKMWLINTNFKFVVVTDDVKTAKLFFPYFDVMHYSIGKDYSIIKNAKYLILSNSSFAFFPTFTSETIKIIIAPKYWGRYNISDGYWHCGSNIYTGFNYLDKNGNISNFDMCINEYEEYQKLNTNLWNKNI